LTATRRAEPLVREDLDAFRVIDGNELHPVGEERFLELVGDPNLVSAFPGHEPARRDPDVFIGIGCAPDAGRFPVPHLTATHEVGHELESRSVPGIEVGARRRLAIELGDS
jgi:hypothetical protein